MQATALRPAWGSALQPGGRESQARPLCAWGSPIYLRGYSGAASATPLSLSSRKHSGLPCCVLY
jgi:hypothetical protein